LSLAGAGPTARRMVVPAIIGAVILAGCSSPKQSATSTSEPTTTTTAPTTTTVPVATTTTTTVPGCTGANYTLSLLGTEGAAGTNEVTFGLRNTSSATCVLFGYPGIELLGAGGAGIATNDVRGGVESFTDFPAADVSVATGATAYFNIGYSDVVSGGESSCPTTTGIQVIPPNTTTELKVAGQFTVCNGGTVDVSPVFGAGSSETQTTAPAQT
jgi:hypothetical protein